MTQVLHCKYEGPDHEFPDDWELGGATGADPRVDPRYVADTYEYWSHDFEKVWVTQVPMCLDEAIDRFTIVSTHTGKPPHWLFVKTKTSWEQVPVEYIAHEDTVYPIDWLGEKDA